MTYTDQLDREIELDSFPKRIVSLVPSQTELLVDLDLESELVGITKFCVHPDRTYRSKTRIGGTKNVDLDKVRELKPDLIIANKEENERIQIETLADEYPVWISDVHDLDSALDMTDKISAVTNRVEEGQALLKKIKSSFENLNPAANSKRTLYLIWKDPFMSVGSDTFIHDMISRCGLENVIANHERYPEVMVEEIDQPELVLLSSEPYPFKQEHINDLQMLWPEAEFALVDGEYFSWYGSRLVGAPEYFKSVLSTIC